MVYLNDIAVYLSYCCYYVCWFHDLPWYLLFSRNSKICAFKFRYFSNARELQSFYSYECIDGILSSQKQLDIISHLMNPPFCWTFSELESGMLTLIIRTFHWKYDFCATLLSGNWSMTHYFIKLNWFMRTSDLLHEVNAIVLSINPLFFLNFLRTCFIHLRFQTDNKFGDIRLELIDAATSEFWWSLDKQCQVEQ